MSQLFSLVLLFIVFYIGYGVWSRKTTNDSPSPVDWRINSPRGCFNILGVTLFFISLLAAACAVGGGFGHG